MNLLGTLHSIWDTAAQAVGDIPTEWNAKVAELKSTIAVFETTYEKLGTQAGVARLDPGLNADYASLMNRGAYVKSVIADTLTKLGGALNYMRSIVGMDGMGNLGALPMVSIAFIVGAIVLAKKWNDDGVVMSRKLAMLEQTYNDAKLSGASPQQLAAISHDAAIANTGSSFLGGDLANKAIFILIAGGLLYLLAPTIKKALGGKNG